MPQLDFITAFPQIFWLSITFFSVYMFLVHYLLPNFIKLIKARKQIIIENTNTLIGLKTNFDVKQNMLNHIIENNFSKIRSMLEKEVMLSFKDNNSLNFKAINKTIAMVLYSNVLYYDTIILKLIPIKLNY